MDERVSLFIPINAQEEGDTGRSVSCITIFTRVLKFNKSLMLILYWYGVDIVLMWCRYDVDMMLIWCWYDVDMMLIIVHVHIRWFSYFVMILYQFSIFHIHGRKLKGWRQTTAPSDMSGVIVFLCMSEHFRIYGVFWWSSSWALKVVNDLRTENCNDVFKLIIRRDFFSFQHITKDSLSSVCVRMIILKSRLLRTVWMRTS